MKESVLLSELEKIAEDLHVKICDVSLEKHSYKTKSGLCRVRGEYRIIMDRRLNLSERVDVLINALQDFDIDTSTLNPKIRRFIERRR